MAILDKQGLQHYANKMCNADNRKVGSKSLPTALNDIDTAIDGFKTLFETEYGTPVNMELENNENIFSVGTGTNVDKRSEVENGFTDVELSGNSLVNCVLIDKLYEDSNYLEFENSPVITEGNITLKSRQLNHVRFCPKIECGVIKPNTKYTLIFNVTSNNLTGRTNLTHTNTDTLISAFPFTNTIQPKQTGIFKYVLTSKEDIGSCNTLLRTIIWNDCSTEGETITFSLMILEGDWTNKPIPQYFKGLKSVGEKEDGNHKISISSVGKNVFNINENPSKEINPNHSIKINDFNGYDIIAKNDNSGWIYSTLKHKIILKPNKDYRISCDIYKSNQNSKACIRLYSPSLLMALGTLYSSGYVTFRTPSVVDDFYLLLYSSIDNIPCKSGDTFSYRNIQIELVSDSNNDYSPFKINNKEISLNEPLRGLPNGVKDTIEKINGEWKIVRRCGCFTLNGSEQWNTPSDGNVKDGNTKLFAKSQGFESLDNKNINIISDKFSSYNADFIWSNDLEGISINAYGTLHLRININKLSEITPNELKNWLAQNPVKCVYKLVTPIIEDISPVTLQCWKNGTISIDEVLPVETTHTVALNKSAQIQKNNEELTTLRNRVKALEEQYDKTALNQAYEVELLRLDMQLDNII